MMALRHVTLPVAVLFCLLFPVSAVYPAEQKSIEFPLSIREAPADVWSKKRLKPQLISESRFVLKDAGNGPFDDSSLWLFSVDQDLPYGPKELSFRIEVDPAHRPLWGEKLLQVFINGKEADAVIGADGRPLFDKIIDDAGDGFVPRGSGTLRFQIPAEARELKSFSVKTAGAENFHIVMSDFTVTAWPEADERTPSRRPLLSQLGFRPGDEKILMIEWHDEAGNLAGASTEITVTGPDGSRTIAVSAPQWSIASGSPVSTVDLSAFSQPGAYTVTLPSAGLQPGEASVTFEISEDPRGLAGHRDDAWGTFYWITDTAQGPFPNAHAQDRQARIYGQRWLTRDISGGWFDAGDYGKYTVNGAYSVALMLLTGLLAPQALEHPVEPLAGGRTNRPDWLDVAETQLDWLVKMQAHDGGANHKAATRDWPGLNVSPDDDNAVKWIMPVSSTATADYAAVMALAAKVLSGQADLSAQAKAEEFATAAKRARDWLRRNPDLVTIETNYDGKDYGGPYFDGDDRDERFFADAAWAALTRAPADIAAVESQLQERQAALAASGYETYWGGVGLLGFWALKTIESDLSDTARGTVDTVLRDAAETWRIKKEAAPWTIPHGDDETLTWGSNGVLATIGWHWLLWAAVSGDPFPIAPARDLVHWFFGRNPLGQTYVTGTGERAANDPHFRPAVSGAIALPDGFLVGGPNSGGFSGDPAAATLEGLPPMRQYIDDRDSYSTNEVAINWQAAWALYLSLLADFDG